MGREPSRLPATLVESGAQADPNPSYTLSHDNAGCPLADGLANPFASSAALRSETTWYTGILPVIAGEPAHEVGYLNSLALIL